MFLKIGFFAFDFILLFRENVLDSFLKVLKLFEEYVDRNVAMN